MNIYKKIRDFKIIATGAFAIGTILLYVIFALEVIYMLLAWIISLN